MTTKLQLPQITLVALTSIYYDAETHQKALEKSCENIEFGDVKIVMDRGIKNVDDWNRKIVYDLWKYVDTEFAFLFHGDGYIIHPELWNPRWLQYDYCGSPWPLPTDNYSYRDIYGKIQRVGNSIGLRSERLMRLPTELKLVWGSYYGNTNEDGYLSVHNRHILEAHGCKFMPFEEALIFGKEHELPENKDLETFCFHSPL